MIENLNKDILACKNKGKNVFYILPAVFRARTRDYYQVIQKELYQLPLDGFVVKSYDELAFVKDSYPCKKEICLDHNMYTYSDYAKDSFTLDGIMRDTVPLELNRKEVAHRNNQNSEMILYGYLPLMVSAGCVHKNTSGCDKKSQILHLQDRYDVTFPVKNDCSECYNIIYNTKPLFLLQHEKELEKLNLSAHRIHFTFETQNEAEHILMAYQTACIQKKIVRPEDFVQDYTNGHYKRGVE
jgi:putative protease